MFVFNCYLKQIYKYFFIPPKLISLFYLTRLAKLLLFVVWYNAISWIPGLTKNQNQKTPTRNRRGIELKGGYWIAKSLLVCKAYNKSLYISVQASKKIFFSVQGSWAKKSR